MSKSLYKALGHMSVAFSGLEDQIKDLVCALFAPDKRTGEIRTCRMNFSALCKLSESLFRQKIRDKELLRFFDELMPRIRQCSKDRNKYIHSTWFVEMPILGYFRSKPIIRNGEYYPFDDDQKHNEYCEIIDLTDRIEKT